GYPPELAYFECCHELKLLVDLVHEHGISGMRERISTVARYGDLTRGERVIGEPSRAAMRAVLEEIRSGQFARELLGPDPDPRARADEQQRSDRDHAVERVGRALRAMIAGDRRPPGGDA